MRGGICFVIALAAALPVSWATSDWRTGYATIAVGGTILFAFVVVRIITTVLFPPRKRAWYGTEQRVR
jgi:hypothetical protein